MVLHCPLYMFSTLRFWFVIGSCIWRFAAEKALGLLCLVELNVDVALGNFFDHVKQCVSGSFLLSGGLL